MSEINPIKGPDQNPGMAPIVEQGGNAPKPFTPGTSPTYTDPWEVMISRNMPGLSPDEVRKVAAKMKAQAFSFVIQDTKKRMDKLREDMKRDQQDYGS